MQVSSVYSFTYLGLVGGSSLITDKTKGKVKVRKVKFVLEEATKVQIRGRGVEV